MTFANSIPTANTMFETFMFTKFGMNVDLSESTTFMAVAVAAAAAFAWTRLYNSAKYSR